MDAPTFKIRSFDCVYRRLGRPTVHTLEHREVPTAVILDAVRRKLETGTSRDTPTSRARGDLPGR